MTSFAAIVAEGDFVMNDPNFWKERYQRLWPVSSKKEEFLKRIIFEETGLELVSYGLGAGEATFIPGSAKANNNEKGAPDFKVSGKNVFIEVTGPLNSRTKPQSGIWIRPDKLNYAYCHRREADEFFAVYFPSEKEWFIIHADPLFFNHVSRNKGKTDYFERTPVIRGVKERYIAISCQNPFVKQIDELISFLKK